jgi:hypothetical protein
MTTFAERRATLAAADAAVRFVAFADRPFLKWPTVIGSPEFGALRAAVAHLELARAIRRKHLGERARKR